MQIFIGKQIHDWDTYTVEHEPIRPIDLMERASEMLADAIMRRWDRSQAFIVFAGPGNNGGDALAVSRIMTNRGYDMTVYLFNTTGHLSEECTKNMKRLQETKHVQKFVEVTVNFEPPQLDETLVVIDGLFGSGLNKPLTGGFASLAKYINAAPSKVVSIDLPSGMMTEDNTDNIRQNIIRADLTLTLQQRKLAMYLSDNAPYFGEIEVLDICLSQDFVRRTPATYYRLEENNVRGVLRTRNEFAHKGQMGHSLIYAGCYGMAGASILAAKACLRSGAGKVTVHIPQCNNDILQISVPEAVLQHDAGETNSIEAVNTDNFESVVIGPGISQNEDTAIAIMSQIRRTQCPMVIDADAINILSQHRAWINQLPRDMILTPHPAEFDRLVGAPANGSFERLQKAREWAERLGAYIILKGHYTAICTPDGDTIINPTGNAGMATAGSGDVLSGIIAGLLARGYTRRSACILGVYLHGLAGDLAAEENGMESLIASDIIRYIPKAFKKLETK